MTAAEMEHIITQYGDDIYRFCFHITGCREEADDLYQDTFVKAIQFRHRLDSSGNVKSYLMGVAANLWKNQVKKQRRREEIVPEVSFEQTGWTIGEGTDSFNFTLKDASGETETLCYTADSKKAIPGTDLVLDDVEITNSALETKCVVNYHTIDLEAKEWDKWINTKDSDLSFYLLDEDGNVIDVKESSGMEASEKNGGRIQQDIYPLQELPEKLTFLVKDCMTKEEIGTVTVTRK